MPWYARTAPPTIHEIYYTQEDIWILRGLMDILANTNSEAKENFQAVVREIEWIRWGVSSVIGGHGSPFRTSSSILGRAGACAQRRQRCGSRPPRRAIGVSGRPIAATPPFSPPPPNRSGCRPCAVCAGRAAPPAGSTHGCNPAGAPPPPGCAIHYCHPARSAASPRCAPWG